MKTGCLTLCINLSASNKGKGSSNPVNKLVPVWNGLAIASQLLDNHVTRLLLDTWP